MAWRGLTKEPWEAIRVHLPQPKVSRQGGRPRVEDRRGVEGILWIRWTGAQWSELPRRYGRPSTCWRRLKPWEATGVRLKLWRAFLAQLNDQQKRRWDACFIDGSFVPAKKGGPKPAPPSGARARSGWFWSMARVLRWELPGRGVPGGSHAPRNHSRDGRRRPPQQTWAAPQAPRPSDRRSGL